MLKNKLLINVKSLTSFNKNNRLKICVYKILYLPLHCKSKTDI